MRASITLRYLPPPPSLVDLAVSKKLRVAHYHSLPRTMTITYFDLAPS